MQKKETRNQKRQNDKGKEVEKRYTAEGGQACDVKRERGIVGRIQAGNRGPWREKAQGRSTKAKCRTVTALMVILKINF